MTRRATADRAASGPATADRTAGGGTARGGAARFRAAVRGRRATAVTVAVALTAVLAGGAGELTARTLIRDRVAGAAPGLGGLTATTGGSALWALVDRHLPHLDIGSDDAHAGPLSGLSVRARLDDVRLGGPARFAGAHAEVTVPARSLGAAVQDAVPSLPVTSATADPGAGTVTVGLGRGGAGRLTLRPELTDGRVSFSVASLTFLGRSVPPGSVGGAGLGAGTGGPYPLGLKATGVRVLPDGVHVTLDGGPGPLPAV